MGRGVLVGGDSEVVGSLLEVLSRVDGFRVMQCR